MKWRAAMTVGVVVGLAAVTGPVSTAVASCPVDDPCSRAKTLARQMRDGELGSSQRFILGVPKRQALRSRFQAAFEAKYAVRAEKEDGDHWWDHFADGVYCAMYSQGSSSRCAAETAAEYIQDAVEKVPVKSVLACGATAGYAVWRTRQGDPTKLWATFTDSAGSCGFTLFVSYILDEIVPGKQPINAQR